MTSEAGSARPGFVQFNDVTGTGSARWATDYEARFPTSSPRLAEGGIVSAGFQPDYTRLSYRLTSAGIDRGSRLLIAANAPAGASVVSPVTSLIDAAGSQAAVRAALQLDTGAYAIPASVDLLNTSGTATGSGPIAAANVRAVLLSQAVYVASRGLGAVDYTPFNFENREADIGAFIRANPSARLFTRTGAEQLLRAYGDRSVSNEVYAALAHLVVTYGDAAVAIQSDAAKGTRFLLGLQSFFFRRAELLRLNTITPAEVLGLTATQLESELAVFADYPAFTATGTLFAGPDFDFLAPGASGSRRRWDQSRDGHGQSRTTGYAENDFSFNPATLSFVSVYTRGGLVSVTVPPANAGQISVGMEGTTITYRALPGFTGVSYFEYVISDELGQAATARFYLIVR